MLTNAILGSTGNIGLSILRELSTPQTSDDADKKAIQINAYARSKSKLLSLYPAAGSNPNISIHAGSLQNLDLLAKCLKDTSAIYLAVAVSDNVPNCSVAQTTARLVIEALERLRSQHISTYQPPLLVVLSSASTSTQLWRGEGIPPLIHTMLSKAASNVYHDLSLAENFLRQYPQNSCVNGTRLFRVCFVKPGGLIHDVKKGHVLSTEKSKTFTSFADCAAGMVEIATSAGKGKGEGEWDGKEVSVNSAAAEGASLGFGEGFALLKALARGLLFHFLPWLYGWL